MKKIAAFLQLIRWPNLFFIVLTQLLFYYFIFHAPKVNPVPAHNEPLLWWLILSSVLIAAAGNIINDYFDLKIDTINKPEKVVVDKFIKRRWAIVWHWIFSVTGVAISAYVGYRVRQPIIPLVNVFCVALLWFYSTHFKRMALWGNLAISVLTAWVIGVVYFFTGAGVADLHINHTTYFKLTVAYAGFAFLTTLIREVLKDMEDMAGDVANGCQTIPIAWGVKAAKVFVSVWVVVTIAALLILCIYGWMLGWWPGSVYLLICTVGPLFWVLKNMKDAQSPEAYHKLANAMKFIMLAGILSMVFFEFLV